MFSYYEVTELALSILEERKLKKLFGSIFNSSKSYLIQDPPGAIADTSTKPTITLSSSVFFPKNLRSTYIL